MEAFLFIIFFSMFFIAAAFAIAMYLFNGFGLMGLAKTCNEKYPYLGFIPYANIYLTGKLAFKNSTGAVIYLIAQIALLVIFYILYFGIMVFSGILDINEELIGIIAALTSLFFSLIMQILMDVAMYKIYKRFTKNYVLLTVFTVLTGGVLSPIFLFAIRKNQLLDN